jgi:flagellin-like hook-associated protein FlgL
MARIGITLSGIERSLLNRLATANAAAALTTLRLAAQQRILTPSDDPPTFVALSGLQSQLNLTTATMSNVTAASGIVNGTKSGLAQIHSQLTAIRTQLLKEFGDDPLTPDERAAAQAEIDSAIDQINQLAATTVDGRRVLDGSADFQVSGRNPSQVRDLRVYATAGIGPIVPAKKAQLTYTGDDRYAAANATVRISGSVGSAQISVTTDDTLEAVAQKINDLSVTTGVNASVDDNMMTLSSAAYGADAVVSVVALSGSFAVSGGDGAGTAQGVTAVYGSTPAISGTVSRAATRGELAYTGTGGNVQAGHSGTLTITGKRGNATVDVTAGEDLDLVAQRVNNTSHETGIAASVGGLGDNELTFTTVDYGLAATLSVSSTGTFPVSGGNGDATAQGTDAVAEINGQTYAGNTLAAPAEMRHREKTAAEFAHSATIRVTGHLGSADIAITGGPGGDTLQDVADAIAAQSGTTGVTARVDQNDLVVYSTLKGAEATAQIEVRSGAFDTVAGYTAATQAELLHTGSDGKIAATSSFRLTGNTGFHDFAVTEGDDLIDVATAINAETAATGVAATAEGDRLYLRSTGVGTSAIVTVTNVVGSFPVSGGNGDGTANGVNAVAAASGTDAVADRAVDGNRFEVNRNGFHFAIEFAGGFSGDFHAMTVTGGGLTFALSTSPYNASTLAVPGMYALELGGLSGTLSDVYSGGSASGMGDNASRAIRIVDEALAKMAPVEGNVEGFFNAQITSASTLLSDLQEELEDTITETDGFDQTEQELLLARYDALSSNALASLAILNQQRQAIVDMIKSIAGLS